MAFLFGFRDSLAILSESSSTVFLGISQTAMSGALPKIYLVIALRVDLGNSSGNDFCGRFLNNTLAFFQDYFW